MANFLLSITTAAIILQCFTFTHLSACPLPQNASCHNCTVLQHINELLPNRLDINIMVNLNLAKAENTADKFARVVNNFPRNRDVIFDSTSSPGVSSCFGNDPSTGSPCSEYVEMSANTHIKCNWNYRCDYSANRFPQYIWRAECGQAPAGYRSQEVFYEISTLNLSSESTECIPFHESQVVYKWMLEKVAVACVCVALT